MKALFSKLGAHGDSWSLGRRGAPLLSHLLLRATAGGLLCIIGSDLKRTVTTECPAAVKTFGEATVPAQKLLAYLKLLPSGTVTVKLLSNHQLQINAGRSRTRMPCLAPNSYPASPSVAVAPLRLSCRGLKTLIRQSLFAVANSEDRYLFNAALLLLRQDRMRRSKDKMQQLETKLTAGMTRKGADPAAQKVIIQAISSFALYGFPESHAASFALLAYASAYLKHRYLAASLCALLNNQPMGFYHPATLVKDAQRHGLKIHHIDVQHSDWKCTLERLP